MVGRLLSSTESSGYYNTNDDLDDPCLGLYSVFTLKAAAIGVGALATLSGECSEGSYVPKIFGLVAIIEGVSGVLYISILSAMNRYSGGCIGKRKVCLIATGCLLNILGIITGAVVTAHDCSS